MDGIYEADINFINGKVRSMENEEDVFEAFSVRDGRFLAVGTTEYISKISAKQTIDLHGINVLPGMIDCHQHTYNFAQTLLQADLKRCGSMEEIRDSLIELRDKTQKNGVQWIQGFGFDEQKFHNKKLPNRIELDEVSKDRPIIITRYCMHICVVNSKVLEMAGMPIKGDGVIREKEMTHILQMIPDPCPDKNSKKQVLYGAIKEMGKYGITGIHPIQGKFVGAPEYLNLYQELYEEGKLTTRVYINFDEFPSFSMKTGFGDEYIKYGFYKIYSDGSLGTRDAALSKPYSDAPGEYGILNHTVEQINNLCREAYEKDIQVGIHAIGDKGIEAAVGAMETCYRSNPKKNVRFRLIHGTVMRENLIERIEKLPIIVDIQPGYTSNTNIWWSVDRLGEERLKLSYAWNTLKRHGIIMTGSSDAPVEPINPFWGIYSVTCRQDCYGKPEGGWRPEEQLEVYDAVCLYTKNAAYSSFEENLKGTISAGKLADFVLVDRDIFNIRKETIKDTRVMETWLGGKKIYDFKEEKQCF